MAMEKYQAQVVQLLSHPSVDPIFTKIEAKTQVKREAVAGGSLAILALYLIFGAAAELICSIIGFVYPAYCSIKAIETSTKSDDTQWLTYWVVYSILSIIELPFEAIILHYFPIYWLAKTAFLMWCYLPSRNNGADFVYNKIIHPLFKQHETQIDNVFEEVTDKATDVFEEAKKIVVDNVVDAVKADLIKED